MPLDKQTKGRLKCWLTMVQEEQQGIRVTQKEYNTFDLAEHIQC